MASGQIIADDNGFVFVLLQELCCAKSIENECEGTIGGERVKFKDSAGLWTVGGTRKLFLNFKHYAAMTHVNRTCIYVIIVEKQKKE